jgi:hypothetical protein
VAGLEGRRRAGEVARGRERADLPRSQRIADGRGRDHYQCAFQAGVPKQLFALPPNVGDWDVTADGKRFLAGVPPVQQTTQTPITVVLNWEAGLKR